MPLYEYECQACGHHFEKIVKFSDPPVETCPKCGGAVRKLISSPAFQFKGSGWYITDYAKKDQSTESKGGKSATTESGEGPASKETSTAKEGDSKPAKDSTAKSDAGSTAAASSDSPKPAKD